MLFGRDDLSGLLSQIALTHGVNLQNETAFGDDTEINLPGIETFSASQSGFWDALVDARLFDDIGGVKDVWSAAPQEGLAGERGFFTEMIAGAYSPGGAHGDIFGFSLEYSPGDMVDLGKGLISGQVDIALAVKTASGDGGTGQELGAVLGTQRLYAAMHVIAAGGMSPTLDVVIESDALDDFASATTRLTFTQLTTTPGAQMKSVAGAITDTFFRARYTIADDSAGSPSYTIFVIIGIK